MGSYEENPEEYVMVEGFGPISKYAFCTEESIMISKSRPFDPDPSLIQMSIHAPEGMVILTHEDDPSIQPWQTVYADKNDPRAKRKKLLMEAKRNGKI